MNADVLKGKWKQLRGTIKREWGALTDDELDRVEGNYDRFIGLLQEKYGYDRAEAEREIDERLREL